MDFRTILGLPDEDAIIGRVVEKEVNEVLYDRPEGWFEYLNGLVNLGCPTADEIGRIAEAKATRDIFTHNKGIANRIYGSKAGDLARFRDGERMTIPEHYHRETWKLIHKVVSDLSNAAMAKAS